jgi:pimeloyl-ACP methyl ester carboxylesterase
MARSGKVELCSKKPPTQATARHWHLTARRRGFAYALLLLVASVPLCAMAQTAQSYVATNPGASATEGLFPLALRNARETSTFHNPAAIESGANIRRVIVIGFVGGFARADDQGHPEVQFAEYLRDRYRRDVHAEVFANHDGKKALHEVLRLLDRDGKGNPSPAEKEHARVIIYGHSWGAAETVVFARELGKHGIPVQLTVQMDSIAKLGRDDSSIPSNVANAINFYQSRGPLHGLTEIVAADPAQTTIIGNLHMSYKGHRINCANYPWYARTFNKPHHEIENDPRVWDLAASLIDSEIAGRTLSTQISSSWKPFVK